MAARLLAAAALATLLGCATPDKVPQEPGPAFLTADELKSLLSETLKMRFTAETVRGTGFVAKDGTAQFDWGTGGVRGTWRIVGNQYCSTYAQVRRGYETCYNLQKTGPGSYQLFFTDGRLSGTWVILQ